ncbi:MAG: helix-turn-helix domain-containing protein [Prevotella sp.]|nr:helix-turn-helix domain-containing protein [Prevotella sp.]
MNRMRTALTLLLALISMALQAVDVKTIDSLVQRFEASPASERPDVANRLMQICVDEQLCDEPLRFGPESHPDTLVQHVSYWAAELFYAYQDYSRTVGSALKAEPLSRGTAMESDVVNLLALSYFRMADYDDAAQYAKRCYQLDEQTGDADLMSSSLNTLAGIYIGANQPKEAEGYILKGIEMARKADNPARMAVLQGMASEVYHALGQDAKALGYINEACDLERRLGRQDRLAVRTTQRASVLIGLHHYEEAERDLGDVVTYLRTTPDRHSLGIALNKLGMAILQQYREADALPCFREAADIFSDMGDMGNEMHARRGLYECLRKSDPEAAHRELDRFDLLKDSLYSHATAESLARYNAEFGAQWLQRENAAQRRTMWLLGAALLLLCIVAVGVWLYMNRRHRVREEALQVIIDLLRRRPADDHSAAAADASDIHRHTQPSNHELLNHVVAFVMANLPKGDLSLETLADELSLSGSQLNRRIKLLTGVTAQQYVLQVRLEHARLLLQEHPGMSVAEIGFQCGFESAASFSRAFRRAFGVAPSQFRTAM